MPNTSRVHAFMVGLYEGLSDWQPLKDLEIEVLSAPVGDRRGTVQLWDATSDEEFTTFGGAMGPTKTETIAVRFGIWMREAGKGEEAAQAARARAYEVETEIKNYLHSDPHVSDSLGSDGWATLTDHRLDQGVDTEGRWALITGTLGATVRLRPGGL